MIVQLRNRSQVTIPSEIIKKLQLKNGDNIDVTLEDNKIVIKPVLIIDRDQAWFWSKAWQKEELEVESDIKSEKTYTANGVSDLMEQLDNENRLHG